MYLFIDTSNAEYIFLSLLNKQGKILVFKKIKAPYQQSEKLLTEIEKIVKTGPASPAGKRDWSQLKGIIVIIGPGGFTSLRIGVATANAMAWALQIPIVGVKNDKNLSAENLIQEGYKKIFKLKKFKQVLPVYGQEPNITNREIKKKNFA